MVSQSQNEASLSSLFAPKQQNQNVDMGQFWHVWDLLNKKFVQSIGTTTKVVTDQDKMRGAIKGLVGAYGDPYTVYFPPAQAEIFQGDIKGNFQGVGMEIGIRNDILTVIAPLPDSPAAKAGIRSGDAVVKINGVSTDGMAVDDAVQKIRGEKGTTVKLTIFRDGAKELQEISVVRDSHTVS